MNHPRRNFDTDGRDLFRQEVFDRLHVMVGGALEFLDAARVGQREVAVQRAQSRPRPQPSSENSFIAGFSASAISHSISTRTR